MRREEADFVEQLKSHQAIINKIANVYCFNQEDKNDLIQEITYQLWRSRNKYNKRFKYSTWVYRIALNIAISFLRKTNKEEIVNSEYVFSFAESTNSDSSESENVKMLYLFISRLKALDKALILLYLEQYSYEEIASTMGLSRTNVATKLNRIKKLLKENFKTLKT